MNTTAPTAPKPRATIARSDLDDQGMAVVWDRGPGYGTQPAKDDEAASAARKAEVEAWKRDHNNAPQPIRMHANDAVHAVQTDPERYALDAPAVDEAEVAAEVKRIQDARAAEDKAGLERAKAVQLAEDRKTAIAAIMARRKAPPRPDAKVGSQVESDAAKARRLTAENEAAKRRAADERQRRDELGAAAANKEAAAELERQAQIERDNQQTG